MTRPAGPSANRRSRRQSCTTALIGTLAHASAKAATTNTSGVCINVVHIGVSAYILQYARWNISRLIRTQSSQSECPGGCMYTCAYLHLAKPVEHCARKLQTNKQTNKQCLTTREQTNEAPATPRSNRIQPFASFRTTLYHRTRPSKRSNATAQCKFRCTFVSICIALRRTCHSPKKMAASHSQSESSLEGSDEPMRLPYIVGCST